MEISVFLLLIGLTAVSGDECRDIYDANGCSGWKDFVDPLKNDQDNSKYCTGVSGYKTCLGENCFINYNPNLDDTQCEEADKICGNTYGAIHRSLENSKKDCNATAALKSDYEKQIANNCPQIEFLEKAIKEARKDCDDKDSKPETDCKSCVKTWQQTGRDCNAVYNWWDCNQQNCEPNENPRPQIEKKREKCIEECSKCSTIYDQTCKSAEKSENCQNKYCQKGNGTLDQETLDALDNCPECNNCGKTWMNSTRDCPDAETYEKCYANYCPQKEKFSSSAEKKLTKCRDECKKCGKTYKGSSKDCPDAKTYEECYASNCPKNETFLSAAQKKLTKCNEPVPETETETKPSPDSNPAAVPITEPSADEENDECKLCERVWRNSSKECHDTKRWLRCNKKYCENPHHKCKRLKTELEKCKDKNDTDCDECENTFNNSPQDCAAVEDYADCHKNNCTENVTIDSARKNQIEKCDECKKCVKKWRNSARDCTDANSYEKCYENYCPKSETFLSYAQRTLTKCRDDCDACEDALNNSPQDCDAFKAYANCSENNCSANEPIESWIKDQLDKCKDCDACENALNNSPQDCDAFKAYANCSEDNCTANEPIESWIKDQLDKCKDANDTGCKHCERVWRNSSKDCNDTKKWLKCNRRHCENPHHKCKRLKTELEKCKASPEEEALVKDDQPVSINRTAKACRNCQEVYKKSGQQCDDVKQLQLCTEEYCKEKFRNAYCEKKTEEAYVAKCAKA